MIDQDLHDFLNKIFVAEKDFAHLTILVQIFEGKFVYFIFLFQKMVDDVEVNALEFVGCDFAEDHWFGWNSFF